MYVGVHSLPVYIHSSYNLCFLPLPAGSSSELTLKPMSPFLQQRQASMRKTKVKRPEKETATTARDEGQDSSLRGAPSATIEDSASVKRVELYAGQRQSHTGN